MRVYHLGERSLWMDEAFSLFGAWPPLRQALSVLIADGVHPPFYYLVQKASFAIGNSELALRWPSAMFGVLAVAAVARLGREWFGWSTGLFAGALLALSPFAVHALPPDLEIDESNPEIKAWLAMLEPALLERIDFPGVALFLYDLDAKEAAV